MNHMNKLSEKMSRLLDDAAPAKGWSTHNGHAWSVVRQGYQADGRGQHFVTMYPDHVPENDQQLLDTILGPDASWERAMKVFRRLNPDAAAPSDAEEELLRKLDHERQERDRNPTQREEYLRGIQEEIARLRSAGM